MKVKERSWSNGNENREDHALLILRAGIEKSLTEPMMLSPPRRVRDRPEGRDLASACGELKGLMVPVIFLAMVNEFDGKPRRVLGGRGDPWRGQEKCWMWISPRR